MARSTENILLWIIRVCAGSILVLPLVMSWQTMFPFIFGKMIAFQILVELAGGAWAILLIHHSSYRPQWRHPVIATLTLFVFILILTMLTGVDVYRSFWSTQERMTGVLGFIHFWLFFLILSSTLKKWHEWRSLLFVSLIVNAIVNMYGIGSLRETGQIIISTLGNPIYVGVYAILHIFMGMFLLFLEKKRLIQVLLAGSVGLNLWMIVTVGSRSVLYSLLVALVVFTIFIIFSFFLSSRRMRMGILGGFGIFLIFFGVSVAWLKTENGRTWGIANLPYTVNRALYGSSASNEDRLALWRIGLIGFRDRPLFGWGWENYRAIYEKHPLPRPFMDQWYDRSHNQIVDVLALTGIVGMVTYGALWFSLFFILVKIFLQTHKQSVRIGAASLVAFFLSYFLQNLTIFDSPVPLITYFFILALIIFFSREQGLRRTSEERGDRPSIPIAFVVPPITVVVLLSIYFFNIAPFLRSSEGIKGMLLFTRDPQQGIELLKKSLSTPSFTNSELLIQAVNSVETIFASPRFSLSPVEKLQVLTFFKGKYDDYLLKKENPNYIQHYIRFASLLFDLYALTHDKNYLEEAERTLSIARIVSPQRYEVYAQFAQLSIYRNEGKKAKEHAILALKVVSDRDRPTALWLLAHASFLAKDIKKGFESLERALKDGFQIYQLNSLAVPMVLAVSREDEHYFTKAREYVDEAIKRNSQDIIFQSAKVILYEKAGETRKSQELFEKIKNQNPEIAQQIRELTKP